jgi:hypothetical protein
MKRARKRPERAGSAVKFGIDAWSLYLDAMTVVGLRSLGITRGGPRAEREAALMVIEKAQSAMELAAAAMSGTLGHTPVEITDKMLRHYGAKVRSNKRRLTKQSG